jgi:hypothetical protein
MSHVWRHVEQQLGKSEQRQHNMIDWSNPKNSWMRPEVREQISAYQDSQIEA